MISHTFTFDVMTSSPWVVGLITLAVVIVLVYGITRWLYKKDKS